MLIALLTDFGRQDLYVGSLRLVIASIAPGIPVVDLTHEIDPQAVDQGAFLVEEILPLLPAPSILVGVVDPGVGTSRRALGLQVGDHRFVGPDNGLFEAVLAGSRPPSAREITSPLVIRRQRSATFEGRDVFAPAAAHLARGLPFDELGPELDPAALVRLSLPPGRVRHVDRFGNLVTDLGPREVGSASALRVGGTRIDRRVRTYGEAPPGTLVWYLGSSGRVEIACVGGSAREVLGLGRGTPVEVAAGP